MGGTLPHRGGHNILEPAYFGKPVIVGPHMENFAEIMRGVFGGGCGGQDRWPGCARGCGGVVARKSRARGGNRRSGACAGDGETRNGGRDRRTDPGGGRRSRARSAAYLGGAASRVGRWLRSGRRATRRTSHEVSSKKLDTPVISVGALTMGGAGKSPFVAHLAQRLAEAGRNPAILTRGYGRKSRLDVIVPRGGSCDRSSKPETRRRCTCGRPPRMWGSVLIATKSVAAWSGS